MSALQMCPKCREFLPSTAFVSATGKVRKNCTTCQLLLDLHYNLSKYGLTIPQYEAMVTEQEGKCKICRRTVDQLGERLLIDHCHNTGKVRGLICRDCSTGLARFKDHPTIIRNTQSHIAHALWGVPYEPDDVAWQ